MLSSHERLTRSEFEHVFKRGRRLHTEHALVVYTQGPSRKLSVVVSKKVAKGAVRRNRLRRQLYELLKETAPPGYHVIVILKPTAISCTRSDLSEELVRVRVSILGVTSRSR